MYTLQTTKHFKFYWIYKLTYQHQNLDGQGWFTKGVGINHGRIFDAIFTDVENNGSTGFPRKEECFLNWEIVLIYSEMIGKVK